MHNSDNKADPTEKLRSRAEARLKASGWTIADAQILHDARTLVHELQVHQIELEIQNQELRLAQEDTETALRQYTDLYEYAPVGYATLDHSGLILRANLACSSLLDTPREELVGRDFNAFVPKSLRADFAGFLDMLCFGETSGGLSGKAEMTLRLRRGRRLDDSVTTLLQGIPEAGGKSCRIALTDLTERKKLEDDLIRARDQAEAATRAKSEFLACMSHEIRTPLQGILGTLQLLGFSPLSQAQAQHVTLAIKSSNRLTRLLTDILDLAQLEAGKLALMAAEFSLEDVRSSILEIFSLRVAGKGIRFSFEIDPQLPPTLIGDDVRLQQILLNLTGNALKFTDQGFVRVEARLGATITNRMVEVEFTVNDSGCGIPQGKLARIFDPFEQALDPSEKCRGGVGLGLAIVKRLTDLMGGTVEAQSVLGQGTTVRFTAPFILPE
ncbi:Signal transduction histidine-protein kinase BarA [Fundidesulfovibrio magnetotacticus]|uniref:histidine kinase n=1 Tax=Fundidesulfovibrio magnetotacticus TaxID=2730080 RepID=A0A6V8LQF6_9BACT|nr:ATP-binding protein [Fundidesulfovibrio magnetotacticus]GFK94752.1 Signal transduction histidine-protein kinase BarA [Fundidesulfovibrio magnetotacticus]